MNSFLNKFPDNQEALIRVLAMPADTNAAGDVFGGWLMSQVDIAGSIAAYRHAVGRVVTVAVNNFLFLKPVYVGDLVSIFADIVKVGNTSMTVDVIAYAQRKRGEEECDRVVTANLTFVAIDNNRAPRKVNTLNNLNSG